MKSMKKHNAFMASIPSKRNDPHAAAAAEVDSPGFLLTTVEKLAGLAQARLHAGPSPWAWPAAPSR